MKRIVAEVERWLFAGSVVEQTIIANLFFERLSQDRNGRAFTGKLVPQVPK